MDKLMELMASADPDARQMAVWEWKRRPMNESLPHLLRLLGDEDWRVRKASAEVLVEHKGPEVVRGILGCLYDEENAGMRNTAMESLHRIGESILPHVLSELARTDTYDVKLALVSLLADLRTEETFQYLLYLIQREKDTNLLSAAINSIGHYRRKESIPPLVRLLSQDNPWLQFHSVEALGAIGEPEVLPHILPLYYRPGLQKSVLDSVSQIAHISTLPFLLNILRSEEKLNLSALHALTTLTQAHLPEIVKARYRRLVVKKVRESFDRAKIPAMLAVHNSTPKADVKRDLLTLFGWIGDPATLPTLIAGLRNPDFADTSVGALIAFGREAWEALRPLLTFQEEDETLIQALRIVEEWGDDRAVPHLVQLLEHPQFPVRLQVLEALSAFPGKDLTLYLLALMDDAEPSVQAMAVKILKDWGTADPELRENIFAKVKQLLSAKNASQHINALQVYVHLKGSGYPEILLDASGDPDPLIRQQAIQLMAEYTQDRFKSVLIHALSDEDPRVRQAAIAALASSRPEGGFEPLLAALEDPDLWIRAAAARVLGTYGNTHALKPLVHHLNNDIPPVRMACLEALGMLADEKSVGVILEQLKHPDIEVQKAALQALGAYCSPPARTILEDYSGHADWRLRAAAIAALGRRPDPSILPRLHKRLAGEPDEYVRLVIVSVLETLGSVTSFEPLLQALDHPELIDKVASVFIARKDRYQPLLEAAWRQAGQRREEILSAILEEMKDHA